MGIRGLVSEIIPSNCWFLASLTLLIGIMAAAVSGQSGSPPQSRETKVAPCTLPRAHAHSAATCNACSCGERDGATAFVVQQPTAATPEEKLKSLAPLLQSLVWAILIAAGFTSFRKEIAGFLNRAKSVEIGDVKIVTEPEPEEPLSTAVPVEVPIEVEFR